MEKLIKEVEGTQDRKKGEMLDMMVRKLLLRSGLRKESESWKGNKERYLENVVKIVMCHFTNKLTQTVKAPVNAH